MNDIPSCYHGLKTSVSMYVPVELYNVTLD